MAECKYSYRLIKDPNLPWEGTFPYERLSADLIAAGHAPVGPDSTVSQIKDAFFDLMANGQPTPEARTAWDQLRQLDQRLVVDFFHYVLPAGEIEKSLEPLWGLDCPVYLPEFMTLADIPPNPAALRMPKDIPIGEPPQPLQILPEEVVVPPVDVGPYSFDILTLLEDCDE